MLQPVLLLEHQTCLVCFLFSVPTEFHWTNDLIRMLSQELLLLRLWWTKWEGKVFYLLALVEWYKSQLELPVLCVMRLTYFLWFLYGKGVVYAVAVFVLHMESSCCIFRHSRCCWNCSVSQSISYVFDTVESLCFRLDKLCLFVEPAMSCHSHLVLARYQLFFFQRYSHLGSEQKLSLFLSACTGYIYIYKFLWFRTEFLLCIF